jgi:hypothetical protein
VYVAAGESIRDANSLAPNNASVNWRRSAARRTDVETDNGDSFGEPRMRSIALTGAFRKR